MVDINPTTSIIIFNENGLKHQLKDRHGQSGLKKRHKICCLQKIHFKYKDTDRVKVKDGEVYTMLILI